LREQIKANPFNKTFTLENEKKIVCYAGASALDAMHEPRLKLQWDELYEGCAWATAFQNWKYVSCWYSRYQTKYTPLIVIKFIDNQLVGILPLALAPNRKIVAAGHDQAEYQGWLSTQAAQTSFLLDAIQLLQKEYSGCEIHLKYLHHQVPVQNLMTDESLKSRAFWKSHQQPVMKINAEWLAVELKKKNRKEKINRLKRLGDLKFEKVESYQVFAAVLDGLIIQCDFRKGAMYGEEFFALDKFKKDFMLQLFQAGMLHVTLLKLNDEIIAANAGVQGKGIVFLQGLNSHSPFYSKYSPGILRFLMLGQQMHTENFTEFDLTPGGVDGYKTDLATDFYEAHEFTLSSGTKATKTGIINKSKALLKKSLPNNMGDLKMDDLRKVKKDLKQKFSGLLKFGFSEYSHKKDWLEEPQKNIIAYSIERLELASSNEIQINHNNLKDLLLFDERESVITRRQFLSDTMKRLEFGHQVYTFTSNGKLTACLWYVPKDAKIEHPTITKAEVPSSFPTIQIGGVSVELKQFFTAGIRNIFERDGTLSTLIFKINKGKISLNDLLDENLKTQMV
jgi:CelD/BcsL family acetyltransferase involved in cellulose biosynthesis